MLAVGEARPVDPSPLELAMKSSIIPSDGEALEDDSPLPKFAEAFGEPEDEYEADAMAEYAAMKAKLERRSKSGRVDDRKEAAELLERLPREGSESIDVSSRELSGPKPREWDEEEKELRDSLTAAQAKLMAKYDAMYEVVKSEGKPVVPLLASMCPVSLCGLSAIAQQILVVLAWHRLSCPSCVLLKLEMRSLLTWTSLMTPITARTLRKLWWTGEMTC